MKPTPRGRLGEVLERFTRLDVLTPLQARLYRARVAGLEPVQIAELVGRSPRKVSIILARARKRLEAAAARSVTAHRRRA